MATLTRIPLIDVQAQYRSLKPELDAAIQRVLDRGQFILGPENEALERELAAYTGTAEAVTLASGTDALELPLRALGIGPGDEVVTTAYSFFATAEAVALVGATPVFVDIDPATYNLDVSQVERVFTARTKAILPVHLYGLPCRMDAVLDLASRKGLPVIEDCAQAMGAAWQGRRVGSLGTIGAFSFFPSKTLGAYGDGGCVTTNDRALAQRLRLLRVHGSAGRYHHEVIGRNSRLDELQAAIVRTKLPHLDRWNELRRRHAAAYTRRIAEAGLTGIGLPSEPAGCRHVHSAFVVRVPNREAVAARLDAAGVATQVYYPSILPQQPALAHLGLSPDAFPQALRASREALALPMYPELTDDLIEQVVAALRIAVKPA